MALDDVVKITAIAQATTKKDKKALVEEQGVQVVEVGVGEVQEAAIEVPPI